LRRKYLLQLRGIYFLAGGEAQQEKQQYYCGNDAGNNSFAHDKPLSLTRVNSLFRGFL